VAMQQRGDSSSIAFNAASLASCSSMYVPRLRHDDGVVTTRQLRAQDKQRERIEENPNTGTLQMSTSETGTASRGSTWHASPAEM